MLFKSKLVILFAVMSFSVIIFGQTRDEFRLKYGSPDNGVYIVRPDIVMTVLYSEEKQAQEFMVAPQSSLKKEDTKSEDETMSLETATEIIDEIIPLIQRGKFVREMVSGAGCSSVHSLDYEKVSIYLALRCTPNEINRVSFAKIRKK
jgi:hypothetical protein